MPQPTKPAPQPQPEAAVPVACPGPEFVRITWLKAIGDEAVGAVEWCERRRADGLARDGFAQVEPEPPRAA